MTNHYLGILRHLRRQTRARLLKGVDADLLAHCRDLGWIEGDEWEDWAWLEEERETSIVEQCQYLIDNIYSHVYNDLQLRWLAATKSRFPRVPWRARATRLWSR